MKLKTLYILILLFLTEFNFNNPLQGQICDDWKSQSAAYVITGTTPNDPDFYIWEQKGNNMHGVHLSMLNAEVIPVYIQQNNNYINFTSRFSPSAAVHYMIHLEVNINDNGYSEIYSGSAMQDIVWYGSSAAFPNLGNYDLKVKVVFFDGTICFRQYKIKVIPASQNLYKDNAGNTLRKWQGNDPNGLNAIVFSEGFDAYNTNGQEMYYWAAADIIECFRNNGYDVFLLDNYFGTQDIRNNAAIFASAVKYVSMQYGQELIVAGGVSMGGIISRYAMAKAEAENNPLPVHTFITIDSPHQGAIISKPLQNFKKDNEEDDEFAKHALSNVAARQLLDYNAYDPGGGVHQAFYEELNSLNGNGYPHMTRNIGVSFSTSEPNPNTGGWYKVTYHTGPFSGTVKTFDLTAAEQEAGSWLPKDLTTMSPIIKQASYWWLQLLVPGITPLYYPTIEFERFTDPTYITHASSLDIRNGNSVFDVTITPENTSWHDVLPADITEDIVNEVILTDEYFQNVHVIGNWRLRGKKIAAGSYVTTLFPVGEVEVHPGGNLEMLASEVIILRDGFITHHGAELQITVDPDLHYACSTKDNLTGIPQQSNTKNSTDVIEERVIINEKTMADPDIVIYPNPACDVLNFIYPTGFSGPITIKVYDIYSIMIIHKNIQSTDHSTLDIQSLNRGTYIVQVSNGKKTITKKFIKK